MPRKKVERLEDWITPSQASEILTRNSGHPVSPDYVKRLGNTGKIKKKVMNPRITLYLRSDVEAYIVRAKKNLMWVSEALAS